MKFLVLRLEGVMQAWGSFGYNLRGTIDVPTHSGVLGLIGSAMGYSRENPDFLKMTESLTSAFRIDQKGTKMRDYQTITVSKPGLSVQKKLVEKMYLNDASFLCFLYDPDGLNNELLEDIKQALLKPKNPLFLGRKSCPPSTRVFERLEEYPSVIDALEAVEAPERAYSGAQSITAEAWIPGNSGTHAQLVKDVPISFSTFQKVSTSRIMSKIKIELTNPYVKHNEDESNLFFEGAI